MIDKKSFEEFCRVRKTSYYDAPIGKEYDRAEADDRRLAKIEEERRENRYPDNDRD